MFSTWCILNCCSTTKTLFTNHYRITSPKNTKEHTALSDHQSKEHQTTQSYSDLQSKEREIKQHSVLSDQPTYADTVFFVITSQKSKQLSVLSHHQSKKHQTTQCFIWSPFKRTPNNTEFFWSPVERARNQTTQCSFWSANLRRHSVHDLGGGITDVLH